MPHVNRCLGSVKGGWTGAAPGSSYVCGSGTPRGELDISHLFSFTNLFALLFEDRCVED